MARSGPVWGVRMVEWGILALVVLCFAGVFGHYTQRVHSQAERSQVLSTLGALRTGLVIHHLQTAVQGDPPSALLGDSANPFDTLGYRLPSYGGEVLGRDVGAIPPGQWVYDAQCGCIGYKPLYQDWLESRENLEALWFQRRSLGGVGVLVPLDRYVWHGELVE